MKIHIALLSLFCLSISCGDDDSNDTGNDITVSFENANSTLSEGGGEQAITVNAPEGAIVTIDIDGTATLNVDYTITGTSLGEIELTIPQGQNSFDLTVTPTEDTDVEGDEDIVLTLIDVQGDNFVLDEDNDVHTVTLTDNDVAPPIQ